MANEDADVEVLRERLTRYLSKIPIGVQNGSVNVVRDFKRWVGEAKKGIRSTNLQVLSSLCNRYEAF